MTKDEGGAAEPLTDERSIVVFSKTWDTAGLVELVDKDKDMIMPGEDATVTLKFYKPMVATPNQQITLRGGGQTIGTGKVDNDLPKLSL